MTAVSVAVVSGDLEILDRNSAITVVERFILLAVPAYNLSEMDVGTRTPAQSPDIWFLIVHSETDTV